jgi:transposase-like protein
LIKKPPPAQLVETRPAALEMESLHHPEQGPYLGPPPKRYSKALHEAIVANIKKGNRPVIAAAMAGIPSSTFYKWMQRGKEGHPHFWAFSEDVELAMAVAEGKAVEKIAGDDGEFQNDPENAKYWLERQRMEGWSKDANAKVQGMVSEFMERLENNLPAVITPEMVGQPMFKFVIAAATGQTVTTARPTFQLTDGSEEDDTEEGE